MSTGTRLRPRPKQCRQMARDDGAPPGRRRAQGRALYDARRDERDACGIGFVADVGGHPSRAILDAALGGLERLRHRGAVAADARTGDGAGVLVPLPAGFFAGPDASRTPAGSAWPWPSSPRPLRRQGGPPGGRAGAGRRGAGAAPLAPGPGRPRRHRRGGQGERARHRAGRVPAGRRWRRRPSGAASGPAGAARPPRPPRCRCTSPPARPGRSPTRRCARPTSSPPSTRTWPTPRSRSRSPCSTSATRPTRALLGARPAVPVPLPQRRDQHPRRQRGLDAGP